ncbi:MAG: hypothetical protein J0I48_04605 [Devosia sp.]|uniref:hypothetical protein n=1 Tax=Devosia sp. 66-22 TaxID=1895753 RepID=UPI0009282A80|nr:hypothetical protein [Devosia sp. 66-22]MBN9345475.1 hypothetical protein [Devosia sp.]OJX47845.1 MAG: hypothetical protein BGO81_00310 [Devosia sp. 66-22]
MAEHKHQRSIVELADDFERLRRRAVRQKRRVDESFEAWQRWSLTMDEAMAIVAVIASTPALTLDDLATKFAAILRAIEFNISIVDVEDFRHLRRFGRDLERLRVARPTVLHKSSRIDR